MLGLLNYYEGNRVEARQWWEKTLQLDPNAVTAANNLAWLYAETGGNLDAALQLGRRALAKYPDNPEFNDTVGWIYYKKELSREAIWYLEQSVAKDKNNAVFLFHLGMAYAQKGEDATARRHLERALVIDKNFPGADLARKTIAGLVY
jgi:tetratricopeptide (TPR) repeat protein